MLGQRIVRIRERIPKGTRCGCNGDVLASEVSFRMDNHAGHHTYEPCTTA